MTTEIVTVETALPEQQRAELRGSGQELIQQAEAIKIANNDQFADAGQFLVSVAALKKKITQATDPVVASTHAAHKAATALRAELLAAPDKADKIVRARILEYQQKEAIERRRIEMEQQASARKALEEQRLDQAQSLADAGHEDVAEDLLNAPIAVARVELPKPKAEGVSTKKVLTFRIIDPLKINRPYLVPDETKIRNQVKATGKDAEGLVGGIEVYWSEGLMVRVPKVSPF